MSKFFVEPSNIGDELVTIDDLGDIQHISKVLRLKEGANIDVSDSTAFDYKCKITYMDREKVEARILDKQAFAREPNIKISLFQGIPKNGKIDLVVQKTVELGVHEIIPVFMDRTVIAQEDKFNKKIERFNTIAAEAAKQCKRGITPQVGEAVTFEKATKLMETFDEVIFPYENETGLTIKDVMRKMDSSLGEIAIIIGPEGGFSEREADILKGIGAHCVSLGKTILRTETASIATVAMVMYEMEL